MVSRPNGQPDERNSLPQPANGLTNGSSPTPQTHQFGEFGEGVAMQLEIEDDIHFEGISFGARKSVAGELVFQTGMVGYPESITDPSYEGQILVITFPLIGNYGVPSRDVKDELLHHLPAHFEASRIHVSGLVVASYSGEDYSHHLATSSLGTWLKEQDVPAMCGVDTRRLTKMIRERGSILGRILMRAANQSNGMGHTSKDGPTTPSMFEQIDWFNPNTKNLVADGESVLLVDFTSG